MGLTSLDWVVIAAYFLLNLCIGFFYMKRASGDVGEFFLSGRSVPWWLAGTSMVATTFGADTPLVVTGLIYNQGIAGNWLWWSFALSGILFGFGNLLFGRVAPGAGLLVLGTVCLLVLFQSLERQGWSAFASPELAMKVGAK